MGDIIQNSRFKMKMETEKALQAIDTIRDFCNNQYQEDCNAGKCPLTRWCHKFKDEWPCNWE